MKQIKWIAGYFISQFHKKLSCLGEGFQQGPIFPAIGHR